MSRKQEYIDFQSGGVVPAWYYITTQSAGLLTMYNRNHAHQHPTHLVVMDIVKMDQVVMVLDRIYDRFFLAEENSPCKWPQFADFSSSRYPRRKADMLAFRRGKLVV